MVPFQSRAHSGKFEKRLGIPGMAYGNYLGSFRAFNELDILFDPFLINIFLLIPNVRKEELVQMVYATRI